MRDKTSSDLILERVSAEFDAMLAEDIKEAGWTSEFDPDTLKALGCLAFVMDSKLSNHQTLADFIWEAQDKLEYYQDMYYSNIPQLLKTEEDEN